jgi:hypothetical protein
MLGVPAGFEPEPETPQQHTRRLDRERGEPANQNRAAYQAWRQDRSRP